MWLSVCAERQDFQCQIKRVKSLTVNETVHFKFNTINSCSTNTTECEESRRKTQFVKTCCGESVSTKQGTTVDSKTFQDSHLSYFKPFRCFPGPFKFVQMWLLLKQLQQKVLKRIKNKKIHQYESSGYTQWCQLLMWRHSVPKHSWWSCDWLY